MLLESSRNRVGCEVRGSRSACMLPRSLPGRIQSGTASGFEALRSCRQASGLRFVLRLHLWRYGRRRRGVVMFAPRAEGICCVPSACSRARDKRSLFPSQLLWRATAICCWRIHKGFRVCCARPLGGECDWESLSGACALPNLTETAKARIGDKPCEPLQTIFRTQRDLPVFLPKSRPIPAKRQRGKSSREVRVRCHPRLRSGAWPGMSQNL